MTRPTFVIALLLAVIATATVLPASTANTTNSNPHRNGNGNSDDRPGGADGENEGTKGARGTNNIDDGNNSNVQDGNNDVGDGNKGGDDGVKDIDIDERGGADEDLSSTVNTPGVDILPKPLGVPDSTVEPDLDAGLTTIGEATPPDAGLDGISSAANTGDNKTADGTCFPESSVVNLENGRTIKMSELLIGDRVSVGGGRYSEVFMFTHKLPSVRAEFLEITTASGRAIRLTAGHYLPVNSVYKDAADVVVGDSLELEDGTFSEVTSVQLVSDQGLYNPQTVHGDVAVNGVRASVYTKAVTPVVAHAMLSPLRLAFSRLGFASEALVSGSGLAQFVPSNGGCFTS